jgi:prepilin-type N-terminal cleavage/methylation domain-containing protein
MMQRKHRRVVGFTLIEILIVVTILGILAGIVIAQFSTTPQESRANTARSSLKTIRSQIELFAYNNNAPPASIQELFDEGYLATAPNPPIGFLYQYDPVTGACWVECTPENTNCPDGIETW